MRKVLAHGGKSGRRIVSAFIAPPRPGDARAATAQWRAVADQIRPEVLKLAATRG
ncbi:hypothetical protein JOH52_005205 [Sinorhizobium meliloti]|nr:hypothetical protein [Sinorhizobium meliloti]MDW9398271.1 hypothetical protein [Sinorhizobium meliloti]MDW9569080.1 hypothetical protein [Sinorhizobium meliloti]MDX0166250.1 hypothetical protein [Sinorhizobium meliloti]MDX0310096.1 hypothetical protein [Sinorhizobium meliloti]